VLDYLRGGPHNGEKQTYAILRGHARRVCAAAGLHVPHDRDCRDEESVPGVVLHGRFRRTVCGVPAGKKQKGI